MLNATMFHVKETLICAVQAKMLLHTVFPECNKFTKYITRYKLQKRKCQK